MQLNDMVLVSVDDHIVEPPTMFDAHIPLAYKDKAPRVIQEAGTDIWIYEGRKLPNIGLNAVVGRPPEEYGVEPAAFDQMRKGAWSAKERVDDMNANGVLGSLGFPTFPGFAGMLFCGASDKTAANIIVKAYNDWHVDEWCASAPGRFIPIAILPLWSPELMVEEIKRVAKKGVTTVSFPDNPAAKGLPSIHNTYWDPVWKALSDHDMVISAHIGTGAGAPHASMESPIDAWITTMPMSISNSAADWLFSTVFTRFPKLKLALSEGGIGWIPYFLERADFTYKHHHAWTNSNFHGRLPSDVFKAHVITCFIDDIFGLKSIGDMNADMVMWECDYPHSDTVWPKCPEYLWDSIQGLAPEMIDKMTHLNAMREYRYDPLTLLGKENCTVGALRAQAIHVDTSIKANMGGHNPRAGSTQQVTSGDVAKLFVASVDE